MAYLDHAATTPMLPEAVEAYVSAAGNVGNASSLHAPGRLARRLVEEARERVAASLGARPSEVIFTGGGTESDNLAVKGIYLVAPGR
jgi:cysteine desulfurase